MPEVRRKLIFDSTLTGSSPAFVTLRPDIASVADVRGSTVRAIEVIVTGGSGSPTFNVEVSPGAADEKVPTTWAIAAVRPPGGGAYGVAAQTIATPGAAVYHLDPSDYFPWVRLTVAANAGAARVQAWVETEV